jgi:hypothetical protein
MKRTERHEEVIQTHHHRVKATRTTAIGIEEVGRTKMTVIINHLRTRKSHTSTSSEGIGHTIDTRPKRTTRSTKRRPKEVRNREAGQEVVGDFIFIKIKKHKFALTMKIL